MCRGNGKMNDETPHIANPCPGRLIEFLDYYRGFHLMLIEGGICIVNESEPHTIYAYTNTSEAKDAIDCYHSSKLRRDKL